MSLDCPSCQNPTLEILHSLELGPDGDSDENTLQTVSCSSCSFLGVAVNEESRRGAGECCRRNTGRTSASVFGEVARLIQRCPRDPYCQCEAHRLYGREYGGRIRPFEHIPLIYPEDA